MAVAIAQRRAALTQRFSPRSERHGVALSLQITDETVGGRGFQTTIVEIGPMVNDRSRCKRSAATISSPWSQTLFTSAANLLRHEDIQLALLLVLEERAKMRHANRHGLRGFLPQCLQFCEAVGWQGLGCHPR